MAHGHDHNDHSAEIELARERTFGGTGVEHDQEIPLIDLANAEERQADIDQQLWNAAVEVGFFQLVNHGIDQADVDDAFERSGAFFDLPAETKARWALPPGTNSGWEYRTQLRPSTGTHDHKESYQITLPRMEPLGLWPTEDDLPGFRSAMSRFELRNWELAMQILASFARKLGFDDEFFSTRHDRARPTYQSTLRLLHYLPVTPATDIDGEWRAGAHTDYDCLTLLHQLPGQRGLQVSPGRETAGTGGETAEELRWTPVEPAPGIITCNIGDMLKRWSDDALCSTLHRVRMPRSGESTGPRYSIAYFAQADTDVVIHGPSGRYGPITAADYLRQRIAANFPEANPS